MTFFILSYEEFKKLLEFLAKFISFSNPFKNIRKVSSNYRIYLKDFVEEGEEYLVIPLKHNNKKIIILIKVDKETKERLQTAYLGL